ncbi:MAG: SPOR domain-containing protein [Betaproteobacteria bacterium]|nr:SPOR domain-containing protein [Betaproteobacteria bacterium]
MRTAFLVLLLANLAFYAWSHYLAPPAAGTDPRPLTQQIQPGALHILTPAQVAAMATAQSKPAPGAPPAPKPATATPAAPPSAAACLEWGPLDPTDAVRAAQALAPLDLGSRLSQRSASEASTWWVFIPPQASLQAAQKKAAELKGLGIDDYYIVPDAGPDQWAISLGIFRSQAAAQARLDALRAKKVHSAQAAPRPTKGEKLWYEVRQVDAPLRAKLQQLAQGFAGSELQECSLPAPSR